MVRAVTGSVCVSFPTPLLLWKFQGRPAQAGVIKDVSVCRSWCTVVVENLYNCLTDQFVLFDFLSFFFFLSF